MRSVRVRLKTLPLLALALIPAYAFGKDCGAPDSKHWTTVANLKQTPITMHWTHEYEGSDSVCELTYQVGSGKAQHVSVSGQPQINVKESLVALVSCADDGCSDTVVVVDVPRSKVLSVKLPISNSQTYLKAAWTKSGRVLRVDVEGYSGGSQSRKLSFICSVAETIECQRSET